jgi:alkanesulfonate monooxygenase SsuD/methylene tetrahydromethanopterin reductase-like flavin-dependent oxidoreductase (luciferase family)
MGFHGIWVLDRRRLRAHADGGLALEAWTALADLAQATSDMVLGTLDSSGAGRPAAVTVSMARNMQALAQGRFCLGMGSGWDRPGFVPADPFPASPGPFRSLEALLRACRIAWSEPEPGQFAETAYAGGPLSSGRPLVLIGGAGENITLPAAAAHADVVNWQVGVRQFTRSSQLLARLCEAADRDPGSVRRTHAARFRLFGKAEELARWRADELGGMSDGDARARIRSRGALCGTATMIEDTIAAYIEAGCTGFIISCDAAAPESLDQLSSLRPQRLSYPLRVRAS